MKNLLIVFILLLIAPSCIVQSKLKDGKFDRNGVVFKVIKRNHQAYNSYAVYAVDNYVHRSTDPDVADAISVSTDDVHFDADKINKIVYDKLAYKTKKLRSAKHELDIRLSFDQSGSVVSISYLFKDNTVISLKDIAAIDRQIKESIQATFTGSDYCDFDVILYPGITISF